MTDLDNKTVKCFIVRLDSLYECSELKVYTYKDSMNTLELYRLPRVQTEVKRMKKTCRLWLLKTVVLGG
mgnify:FL=1